MRSFPSRLIWISFGSVLLAQCALATWVMFFASAPAVNGFGILIYLSSVLTAMFGAPPFPSLPFPSLRARLHAVRCPQSRPPANHCGVSHTIRSISRARRSHVCVTSMAGCARRTAPALDTLRRRSIQGLRGCGEPPHRPHHHRPLTYAHARCLAEGFIPPSRLSHAFISSHLISSISSRSVGLTTAGPR